MRDGPRRFPQDSSCPAVLRYPLRVRLAFAYVAITLSGRSFQTASASQRIGNSTIVGPTTPSPALKTAPSEQLSVVKFPLPTNHHSPRTALNAALGLGSSDFARRYFRNHYCFLFLQVLRWFTSLGSLHTTYVFSRRYSGFAGVGSPIRRSPDQRLLAASRGLSQLATSFIAFRRLGIHRIPLVA